jgi:beta-N-acetylhexosaminidase
MRKRNIFVRATILVALISVAAFLLWERAYKPYKFARLTDSILQKMTVGLDDDAYAGQVMHIAIPGTELNDQNRKIITDMKPGGIIFFGFNLKDASQIKGFTRDLQQLAAELNLPPFMISTDQEGGYVRRVRDGVLQTPPARNLGDTGDAELCRSTGYQVSRDLAALGINVFFAPIVDINNNPQNPVIGLRSFGTTIQSVLDCALPFERGARQAYTSGGAMPVIKHFPGHGDTQVDSHWSLPVINKTLDELNAFELIPFQKAIASGAPAVMTAHILYPSVDAEAPATLSPKWLTLTLRDGLKFQGVVFTDAMEMSALSQHYKDMKRPVTALKAGADIMLFTSWQDEPPAARKQIVDAMASGELPRFGDNKTGASALERAVKNQLLAKLPFVDLQKYLSPEEKRWYEVYRSNLNAVNAAPIPYDAEQLKEKFKQIKWSPAKKKGGPIWLAGRKNVQ